MNIEEALNVFDRSASATISVSSASIYLNLGQPCYHAAVRRRKDESLAAMIIRCAEQAIHNKQNGVRFTGFDERKCAVCFSSAQVKKVKRQNLCATCRNEPNVLAEEARRQEARRIKRMFEEYEGPAQ